MLGRLRFLISDGVHPANDGTWVCAAEDSAARDSAWTAAWAGEAVYA